jgi:hypothetical protein
MNLSKVLESINYTKENVLDPNGKDYVPFVVNKSLSYFMDTVAYANEMNKYPFLDKRMQYDYLKGSIRKRKRFSGWVKKDKSDVIDAIIKYYDVSYRKALEYEKLLTEDQKQEILKHIQTFKI